MKGHIISSHPGESRDPVSILVYLSGWQRIWWIMKENPPLSPFSKGEDTFLSLSKGERKRVFFDRLFLKDRWS
jgi:hypothetical protein